ncbi:MAG: glycosyltransferase [Acidobacteriota bacterium]|nr:glycosyltransferase [Acidobacteriota bacterium]
MSSAETAGHRPTRVLNVASSPHALGGVEALLVRTAADFNPQRFAVAYCNLFFEQSSLVSALRDRGTDTWAIAGSGYAAVPRIVERLRRTIRRNAYGIVHTHMLHATILGQLAAIAARAPVRIVTRHYTDYHITPALRAAERFVTRRATRVIAVSDAVRRHLISVGVPADRIDVVYNGVDIAAIDACRLSGALPWPAEWRDAFLIVSVGNLIGYKDQETLLRAFARVHAQLPDARLVLIGEGGERPKLQDLAQQLGIGSLVAMPGHRTDIGALLRHCHVYVQPSLIESFGIAAAEAMAAQLPVVATRVGGLPELVVDGTTGMLVEPRDAIAIAGAVLALARDRVRASEMGRAGRARVEREFTLRRNVEGTEAVYESALAARGAGR